MRIAVRGGHNFLAKGATALIDETIEDRKVKDFVVQGLRSLGHDVLDVTPPDMDTSSDLVYGVSKANNWNADLFISIHFNKAYDSYDGEIGTEAWVYSKNDSFNDEEYAQRIVKFISNLGFKNRGVKESKDLYELKASKMPSVIVEICFVEATKDVELYKALGPKKIADAIVSGISNKTISGTWVKDSAGYWWREADGSYPKNTWKVINNKTYWFKSNGYMATNWEKIGGYYYYFGEDGSMKTGWQYLQGIYYYLEDSGRMITGWRDIGGKTYFFNDGGHMLVGLQEVDNNKYYFGKSGSLVKNINIDENGVITSN